LDQQDLNIEYIMALQLRKESTRNLRRKVKMLVDIATRSRYSDFELCYCYQLGILQGQPS